MNADDRSAERSATDRSAELRAIDGSVERRATDRAAVAPTPTSDRIAVIIGSTRPGRICPGIATWVKSVLQDHSSLRYELIDLAEIDLPFLDEPRMAALCGYQHEHTRAWSRVIEGYRGFVFVFPQYNWGYPAPLKNALDFLYHEWHDKPVTSVTYGTRGGNRGALQIHQVFSGLQMRILDDHVEVVITVDDLDPDWQLKDLQATMSPCHEQVRRLDVQMTEALRACQGDSDQLALRNASGILSSGS